VNVGGAVFSGGGGGGGGGGAAASGGAADEAKKDEPEEEEEEEDEVSSLKPGWNTGAHTQWLLSYLAWVEDLLPTQTHCQSVH